MVQGTMVCPSFVLRGDANTGSAGYVCLETELVDGESDFHATMLAAFAFAALLGLPSFFAVVCRGAATLFLGGENDFYAAMLAAFSFAALLGLPSFFAVVCRGAATLFLGGENDFYAAMLAAFAFAAIMGWPSCFVVASPAVLAALSGVTAYLGSGGGFMCETVLEDGESDFLAALLVAFAFAVLKGWPSCFLVDSLAVPVVLSGGHALLCCAFRGSSSFLGACCDAVLVCAFRWLRWVCLLR